MADSDDVRHAKPQHITLQVPEHIDLKKMSNQEIEHLAMDLARKAAPTLGKGATVHGVSGVQLVGNRRADVGVEVSWTRACGSADLRGEGIAIDPAAFQTRPGEAVQQQSVKTTIETTRQQNVR